MTDADAAQPAPPTGADVEQGGDGSIPPPQPDPKAMAQQAAGRRLQQTQAQVNEVVGIMRVNVEGVLQRDANLAELDQRADHLQAGASQFEAAAGKLKRKFWWKNCKMMIITGVVITLVLAIGGVWIAQKMGYIGGDTVQGTAAPPIQQYNPYNVPPQYQPPVNPPQLPADGNSPPAADGNPQVPAP